AYTHLGNREHAVPEEYRAMIGPTITSIELEFPAGGGYALVLDMDPSLGEFRLSVRGPDGPEGDAGLIAWDDQAHWHPHVLRWEELDLLCRAVALLDPSLPHPGLTLLFLYRFAPVCVGDDVDVIFPLLEGAWHSLGVLTEKEIARYIERNDCRQARFTWRRDADAGWVLEQPEEGYRASERMLYTLRTPGNEEFPFETFDGLVEAARRTCREAVRPEWLRHNEGAAAAIARRVADSGDPTAAPVLADALEEAGCDHPAILGALRSPDEPARACGVVELLLGEEPGACIRRCFGPTKRTLHTNYLFNIRVPLFNATVSLPEDSGLRFARALDAALSAADLGGSSVTGGGSTYTAQGELRERTVVISARVRDELERGIAVIREALARAGAPEGTTITLTSPERREIPLRAEGA
ncbi:MAG TPA: hypothetical protein VIL46_14725, partial [Gemmataceae bacterium]